jgi:hypothetical protein
MNAPDQQQLTREATAQIWRDFCAKLAEAGDVLLRPEIPDNALHHAEGLRYLTHLLRSGLLQNLEMADADFPAFFQPSDEITKFGGDNPDNIYLAATIRGDQDYRITGTRGTVAYFSMVSNAFRPAAGGMITTGELNDSTLQVGPDGAVEIIASSKPQKGNWLKMEPDCNVVLVRMTRLDHKNEKAGTFRIERVGATGAPKPLDPKVVEAGLQRTAGFVANTAARFAAWLPDFQKNLNQMPDIGREWFKKQGGDPSIISTWGYYRVAPDEAWVVDFKTPDVAPYWSFTLYSCWTQSMDYRYRPTAVNKHSVKRNADGTATIVIAARDVGVGNWLDLAGHYEGVTLFRGIGVPGVPEFKCRVAKLSELQQKR